MVDGDAESPTAAKVTDSQELVNTARAAQALQASSRHLGSDARPSGTDAAGGALPDPAAALNPSNEVQSSRYDQKDAENRYHNNNKTGVRDSSAEGSLRNPKGSVEAVDALVTLKQSPPKASRSDAQRSHPLCASPREERCAFSPPRRDCLIQASEEPSQHKLPAIHTPASQGPGRSNMPPGNTERVNLPPLSHQLKQLSEAATRESGQTGGARTNGNAGKRRAVSTVAGDGAHSVSTSAMDPFGPDRPKARARFVTASAPQHFVGPPRSENGPADAQSRSFGSSETSSQKSRVHAPELPSPFRTARSVDLPPRRMMDSQNPSDVPTEEAQGPAGPAANVAYSPVSGIEDRGSRKLPSPSMRSDAFDRQMDADVSPVSATVDRPQEASTQAGGFTCDHPGCTAPPFHTQYLLNSHANVHSEDRPHFCPVESCPRGIHGIGFKRKNEMNRHGLVHASPGYVCPYCPDREHRYPRPDNLQRHVRGHHQDKTNDGLLREVLSQRPEGGNRGRRRRHGH